MPIVRPVRFIIKIQFVQVDDYCLCCRLDTQAQVLITFRLKELIEQKRWSEILQSDLEELRSLRELGFVEEELF